MYLLIQSVFYNIAKNIFTYTTEPTSWWKQEMQSIGEVHDHLQAVELQFYFSKLNF